MQKIGKQKPGTNLFSTIHGRFAITVRFTSVHRHPLRMHIHTEAAEDSHVQTGAG